MQVRLAVLAFALPVAALAAPVYEQAPVAGLNVGYTWASQFDANQSGAQTYDSFSLSQAANIGRVTWRGIYLTGNPQGQCCVNGASNSDSWTVEIYSDVAGKPGALAYSQTVAAAQVDREAVAGGGFWGGEHVEVYDFDLQLGSMFGALAGTQYWFSVRSNAQSNDPHFSWSMAGPWDAAATSFQRGYTNGQLSWAGAERPGDRAFALYAVPEPQALGLAGLALVAAFARRRRASA